MPAGAPRQHDRAETSERIFDKLAEGRTVTSALREEELSVNAWWKWLDADPELAKAYARAKEQRADALADLVLSSTEPQDGQTHEQTKAREVYANNLKWAAKVTNPARYGDKVDLTSAGEKIEPQTIIVGGNPVKF